MSSPIQISDKDGEIVVESIELAVKIATSRETYVRYPGEKQFRALGRKVPEGLSRADKEHFALRLRQMILERKTKEGMINGS